MKKECATPKCTPCEPPGLPNPVAPPGTIGTPYNAEVALGGSTPTSFTHVLSSGNLTATISANGNIAITGTPTRAVEKIAVQVENPCGCSALVVTVNSTKACVAPDSQYCSSLLLLPAEGFIDKAVPVVGTDLKITASTLPPGVTATIIGTDLVFNGASSQTAATFPGSVTLSNACGTCTMQLSFTKVVEPACAKIEFVGAAGNPVWTVGDTVPHCYVVTFSGTLPLSLASFDPLPRGLSITVLDREVRICGVLLPDPCSEEALCLSIKFRVKNACSRYDYVAQLNTHPAPPVVTPPEGAQVFTTPATSAMCPALPLASPGPPDPMPNNGRPLRWVLMPCANPNWGNYWALEEYVFLQTNPLLPNPICAVGGQSTPYIASGWFEIHRQAGTCADPAGPGGGGGV